VQGVPTAAAPWLWLAGLGVLHTGLAYVLLYAGMARLPAGQVAVLQFVYPAAALLIDAVVYGHVLDAVQTGGVVLMAMALLRARRS
jgi:drug/metabolite transporter (DMT)-like permease